MFLKNQRNKIEGQNTKRIGGGVLWCVCYEAKPRNLHDCKLMF